MEDAGKTKNASNIIIGYLSRLTSKIKKLYTTYLIPTLIIVGIWLTSLFLINGDFDFSDGVLQANFLKTFFTLFCWLFLAVGFAHFNPLIIDTKKPVWNNYMLFGIQIVSILIPLAYVVFLPSSAYDINVSYGIIAFVLVLVSLIWGFTSYYLIPQLSPYKTINPQYSYSIFSWQLIWQSALNFVLVGIVSLVALVGVTLIPMSISILFKVQIDSKIYSSITATALILFSGLFYLVEFPTKSEIQRWFGTATEAGSFVYPRFLGVLLPYAGLPVVTIYAGILNAFVVSILISGNWPQEGVIYYMISLIGSSVLITMALEPVLGTRKILRIWTRLLYVFSLPSIAVYFYGIIARIQDQGLTVSRYVVVLIGIVLFLTVVNNLINRLPKFSVVLCLIIILGLVASINPIGISSTVVRSQSNLTLVKLRDLGALQDSKLIPQSSINDENSAYLVTRFEILDSLGSLDTITQYLDSQDQGKYSDFESKLDRQNSNSNTVSISDTKSSNTNLVSDTEPYDTDLNSSASRTEWLITYLGGINQSYFRSGDSRYDQQYSSNYVNVNNNSPISINGYKQQVFKQNFYNNNTTNVDFGSDVYLISLQDNRLIIQNSLGESQSWNITDSILDNLNGIGVKSQTSSSNDSPLAMKNEVSYEFIFTTSRVKVVLTSYNGNINFNQNQTDSAATPKSFDMYSIDYVILK